MASALAQDYEAAVAVMDGRGAWEATSLWHGRGSRLEHLLTIPFPDSIGFFYSGFTEFLGFTPNSDEWKVMGLAPYGRPGVDLSAFIDVKTSPYRIHARQLAANGTSTHARMAALLGPARVAESEIDERHKNIAYAVQDACETAMMNVMKLAIEKTGCRNVCLAGGVALNSKANGKIAASGMVDRIFVQPAASDDGVALGAALAPYLDGAESCRIERCGMDIGGRRLMMSPSKRPCAPTNCATRSWLILPAQPPNFFPKERSWDGFKDEWSLARARWEAARFSRIRVTRK